MKKVIKFLGSTSDGRKVGVLSQTGNPMLSVAIQGRKSLFSLPKERQEAVLMSMGRMTADQLARRLW